MSVNKCQTYDSKRKVATSLCEVKFFSVFKLSQRVIASPMDILECPLAISLCFFLLFWADSVTNKNFPFLFLEGSGTSWDNAIFLIQAALLRMHAGLAYLISGGGGGGSSSLFLARIADCGSKYSTYFCKISFISSWQEILKNWQSLKQNILYLTAHLEFWLKMSDFAI